MPLWKTAAAAARFERLFHWLFRCTEFTLTLNIDVHRLVRRYAQFGHQRRSLPELTKYRRTYPWNPSQSAQVTPAEYEAQVCSWLSQSEDYPNINWINRKVIPGRGGDYEIDVLGEMTLLGGALIRILVECKRWSRPVGRDVVLAHAMKLQYTAAHKGMIFATSGFQRGAIKAATEAGIATLTFEDGNARYETRSMGPAHEPPDWITFPTYAAYLISATSDSTISVRGVSSDDVGPLAEWLRDGIAHLTPE